MATDLELLEKKLDAHNEIAEKLLDSTEKLKKLEGDSEATAKTIKDIETNAAETKQLIADMKVSAHNVESQDTSTKAASRAFGLDIIKGHMASTGNAEKSLSGKGFDFDALNKDLDTGSDNASYITRATRIEEIQSCQETYGVIRQEVAPIPMTNELVWLEEDEDVNPDVTVNAATGCCVATCPASEDLEGWEERRIQANTFYRSTCIPNAIIEDSFIDVVGDYAATRLARKFSYIEDFYGFNTLFNGTFADYPISGAAYASNIAFISEGTPGNVMTVDTPSTSIITHDDGTSEILRTKDYSCPGKEKAS